MNSKQKLYILLFFPVILYLVPFFDFVPEIDRDDIIFGIVFIFTFIYLLYLIKLWSSQKIKRSVKIKRGILIIIFGIIHFSVISIIEFRKSFDFISEKIVQTEHIGNRKIYLIKKEGILKMNRGYEIGYKGYIFPIYNKYYETQNFLEYIGKNGDNLCFKEYGYKTLPDSIKLFSLQRIFREKTELKTICLNSDDIR